MLNRNSILYSAVIFVVLGGARWYHCWEQGGSKLFPDVFTLSSFLVAIILLDIYKLEPASSHTFKSLLLQYCFLRVILISGYLLRIRFHKECKRCNVQQENILKEIITQNKDTQFSKDHGLTEFKSVEDFRSIMPLTRYEDYRNYAEMIKEEGTPNLLFPGKTDFLALTSGTTSGKSKAFPKKMQRKGLAWLTLLQYLLYAVTGKVLLKKWVYVQVKPKIIHTKSGIKSGPISAVAYKLDFPYLVVPNTFVHTEFEVLYIHLVFGLAEEDTTCFSSMVATTALSLFTILEREWESICTDIETGTLSEKLNISDDERNRIKHMLKPNKKRAVFLRNEFASGFQGIVSRIWPSCPCLLAVKTGVFELPGKIVKEKYLGELPCVTLLHIGTETIYGMNIDPMAQPDVNLVAFLPLNFFEFIPVEECGEESPSTVLAHQVKVGQMYEMVITTYDGLYRYRSEDVVKITGFHGTTPVYKFIHRAGDILTAHTEKVPEFLLREAVDAAAARWKKDIVEFTSCESMHVQMAVGSDTLSRHYVVFIEFRDAEKVDETEIKVVDEELCGRHAVYSAMRANNRLEPVQLVQMETGALERVKEMMLTSNPDAFCMQFKLPRIMRRTDILKAMLNMRL